MSETLVSYTQSPNHANIQDLICYCARVSNPSNQLHHCTLKMRNQHHLAHS